MAVEKFTHEVLALPTLLIHSIYSGLGAIINLSQILTHVVLRETIIPIYRCSNRGTEKLGNLLKIMQLASDRVWDSNIGSRAPAMGVFNHYTLY